MDFQVGTWTGLKRRLVPMRAINYLTRVCSRLVQMKIKWLSHLRSLTRRRPLNIDMRGGGSTPRKKLNEIHLVVFGKFVRCCHSSTRSRAFLQRSRNFQLLLTCLFHFAHQSQEVNNIYILSIDLFNTLSREFYFFVGETARDVDICSSEEITRLECATRNIRFRLTLCLRMAD